jgi:hypothetical protein
MAAAVSQLPPRSSHVPGMLGRPFGLPSVASLLARGVDLIPITQVDVETNLYKVCAGKEAVRRGTGQQ